jgi:HTH-type transcriptional repressor of NAD biosynthesis genes
MSSSHPFEDWDSLPRPLREPLTARIVVLGAESTGKTTLVRELVQHYRARGGVWAKTLWVSEFGRDYTVTKIAAEGVGFFDVEDRDANFRSADWVPKDFTIIALEQQRLEDQAAGIGSPVLFCDTDALATRVWERRYLGEHSDAALDAVPTLPRRALYILTDPLDVGFSPDPIRDGEHIRDEMTDWFRVELAAQPDRWVTARGSREDRLAACIRLVDEVLGEYADSFSVR